MTHIGVDPVAWPARSSSTLYDVIDPRNGERLPPKLVLATAAQIATGRQVSRRTFYGGPETNERLTELGFSILPKSAAGEVHARFDELCKSERHSFPKAHALRHRRNAVSM
jgi:hypothetical protein